MHWALAVQGSMTSIVLHRLVGGEWLLKVVKLQWQIGPWGFHGSWTNWEPRTLKAAHKIGRYKHPKLDRLPWQKGNPTEHGLDRRKPRILNRGLRRGQKSERFHGWTWSSGARKIRGVSAPCLSKRCLSMWVVKYLTEKTSIFVTSVICIWFVLRGQVVLRNNVGSLCRFRCFADS